MRQKQLCILRSILLGLFSLFAVFIAVPYLLPRFLTYFDFVWISIRILTPIVVAVLLMGKLWQLPPSQVWYGLPIQYLALFLFRVPITRLWGLSLRGGFGGLIYLVRATVWPLGITVAQFFALWIFSKINKSNGQKD